MSEVRDEVVDLGDDVRLAVRVTPADLVGEGGHARAGAVLVHGRASDARDWDPCARALAAGGVTSVAPDLRDHGGTAAAVADVVALVAHYQLDGTLPPPLVLVGRSWGGGVVLGAAVEHAGVVDALALVAGGPPDPDVDPDARGLYPSVTVPVLLALTGAGPDVAALEAAADLLPDPRLRRYDESDGDGDHDQDHDGGDGPPVPHPERLAADLLALLDELSLASLPSEEQ